MVGDLLYLSVYSPRSIFSMQATCTRRLEAGLVSESVSAVFLVDFACKMSTVDQLHLESASLRVCESASLRVCESSSRLLLAIDRPHP